MPICADEYALHDKLENIDLGKQKTESRLYIMGNVLLWFALPLLLVLGLDILVIKRRERIRAKEAYGRRIA